MSIEYAKETTRRMGPGVRRDDGGKSGGPQTFMRFLYLAGLTHLAFKRGFFHLADVAVRMRPPKRDDAMTLSDEVDATEKLTSRLRDADAVTAELFSDVIGTVCRRFPSFGQPNK